MEKYVVYGISLYSLFLGDEGKYKGYDTKALLRAHEWGLFFGERVNVPAFTLGNSFIIMRNERCQYELEIEGQKFTLRKISDAGRHSQAGAVRLLAQGGFEPGRLPDDKETLVTFYCVADDGWHYSLHCKKPAISNETA